MVEDKYYFNNYQLKIKSIIQILEKINFNQCDLLSNKQLNALKGGQTHESVSIEDTTICGQDISYIITWDGGGQSPGLICLEELDE